MKRIIGLLLCVAMLFSMASIGVSAAYQEHIPVSGTTQNVDGATYKIVKTASEFTSALSSGGLIMLGSDIALTSSSQLTIKAGTLIDGNGYAITYNGTLYGPLFLLGGGSSVITIRNLQLGTSAVPMTSSGAVGLFTETTSTTGQNRVIWQNDTFYIKNTGATTSNGGVLSTTAECHEFSGCTVNIDMLATGGSLFGGFIGSAGGELHFNDCVVTGSIKGTFGVGGFVGQNSTGRAYFENCVNHAAITATGGYCGGFSGNAGSGMAQLYFLNCTNYGAVESTASGYSSIAGGMIGRISNTTTYQMGVNGFFGCTNYGLITSKSSAGGIAGRHHDNDGSVTQYLRFRDCLNAAQVKGTSYAGGIVGAASPVVSETLLINCANIAKVTGSNYVGNFAGMLSGAKLTNCYAAGYVTGTSNKTNVIAGICSGTYTLEAGDNAGTTKTFVEPTVSNVFYKTNLKDTTAQGATKVSTDAELATMTAAMKALYGMTFISSDKASTAGGYLIIADPQIRGVQQSTTTTNGKTDLRFAAVLNALVPYQKAGFRATIRVDGQSVKVDRTTDTVYTSLNATSVNGEISTVTAKSLAGQYLTAVTFTGIPTSGNVTVEIAPYAVGTDGTEYVGKTRVIVVSQGVCKTETMLLNGVALEKFSIVYPASSPNNEKLLAERLAEKLGTMLGHTVTCYSDSTAKKENEILVGKTNRHTPTVSGRWIYRPNEADTTVVLTASNTTALSETVEYFLETLLEKRAAGQGAWTISGSISVPIDEGVAVMTYNTGGTEDASSKKAVWGQMVDTLPDIITLQEPWAAWLDDFLNDYAVKPSTSFASSSIDVMSTSVNNKAFTGSGYYGVYWGLPRWVKGNANTSGRASYSVILYAKDRFTVNTSKSGTFWLSDTPNVSGSALSNSEFPRCATYATLTDKNTNESFVVVNVHLDFDSACKKQQIDILRTQLASRVGSSIPIIVTGDMNAQAYDTAMTSYFNNGWVSLDTLADVGYHNNSTIDWLLTNKPSQVSVQRYEYLCNYSFYSGLWSNGTLRWQMPSDHPAVYAEVTVNTGKTRPGANTENAPAAAHSYGEWTENPDTSDSHYRECECGERETGVCNMEETMVILEPTHLLDGQTLYTCSICGRTQVRKVDKIATHEFDGWTPDTNVTDGHYRDCYCGEHEAESCSWEMIEELQKPTPVAEGSGIFTCSKCGRTETLTIAKLPDIEVDLSNVSNTVTMGTDTRQDMGSFQWFLP